MKKMFSEPPPESIVKKRSSDGSGLQNWAKSCPSQDLAPLKHNYKTKILVNIWAQVNFWSRFRSNRTTETTAGTETMKGRARPFVVAVNAFVSVVLFD